MSAASANGRRWRPPRGWSRSISSTRGLASWSRPIGASSGAFRPRRFASALPREGADAGDPRLRDLARRRRQGRWWRAEAASRCPTDALIGPDGALSSDPALLYGPNDAATGRATFALGAGAIRAFGEHKGSGLALMCELLGGSLTGNGATEPGRRFANGMFSLYVDPARIDPAHLFDARHGALSRLVPAGQDHSGPGDPDARRGRARLARRAPRRRGAAAPRNLGIDRRRGARRRPRRCSRGRRGLTEPARPVREKFGKSVYAWEIGWVAAKGQFRQKLDGRRFAAAKIRVRGHRRSRRVAGDREEQDVDRAFGSGCWSQPLSASRRCPLWRSRRRGSRRRSAWSRREKKPITSSSEYVGRIQAINRVDIVARVTAFLDARQFTEGAEVKKGDVLYRLERPVRGRCRGQAGRRSPNTRRSCRTPT